MPTNRINLIATLVASLLLFTACTGGDPSASDPGAVSDLDASQSAGDADGVNATLGDIPIELYSDSSTRAVVVDAADGGLDVLTAPNGDVLTTLTGTTEFGSTRVLLVEDKVDGWVRVRLPARPNHRTGWIPASSVETEAVNVEVVVDLQARSLSVTAGDDLLVRSPIAIGTDENPTPLGTFYVTDKIDTQDPNSAYGPYAFGLSGYSETLTEFAGGEGQIGIHGTNNPDSIGKAVSHGCIRLPNEVVEALVSVVPLGTPVHIV